MRKFLLVFSVLSVLLLLPGCESERVPGAEYPSLEYRNSKYNFDSRNREIAIEGGYVLDEGHSYDVVETDNGYDLVLHFVAEEKTT